MNEDNVWENAEFMFEDIKKYPHKVEQFDDPIRFLIGYKSTVDDSIWFLDIKSLKLASDLIKNIFKTAKGKENLLNGLNEGKQ